MKTKTALRNQFRHYRDTLTVDSCNALSRKIQLQLRSLTDRFDIKLVLSYLPIPDVNEIDMTPVVTSLVQTGATIALPVVTSYSRNFDQDRIELRSYNQDTELITSQYGISEPVNSAVVPISEVDLALIPALGAGRNMFRIGNGLAYYDEILRNSSCTKICCVYSRCLVESVPFEDHDISVDYIVTEDEIIGWQ